MEKFGLLKLKDDCIPLAIFLVLPILYLSGALFSADNVLGSPYTDIKAEVYGKTFAYEEWLKFSVPLWNPYRFSGMPHAATPGNASFYPFHLICTILPIAQAINWDIAFHLFLSGVFTYYLLKNYGLSLASCTVGGIVYAFSAPQIMHIYAGHLIANASMPWAPLLFLCLDKLVRGNSLKYGIFLSIAIAFQLLAGYTQYLFYSMIMLSLYLFFLLIGIKFTGFNWSNVFSKILLYVAFILLGLALSAIQILPTMEMISNSTRQNLSYEFVSIFSFPPENLVTFLIPDFLGDMIKIPYWGKNYLWEMTAYVGIIPLILAGIAVFFVRRRIVWFFAGLAVVSIILALGKYTPILKFLYTYIPGFHLFRGNSKFIFLASLSLAVLSGFGADAVIKHAYGPGKRFRTVILGFGIFLTAGLLVAYAVLDEAWFREAIIKVIFSGDLYGSGEPFMQAGFAASVCASFKRCALWTIGLLISGTAVILLYSYGKLREKALIVPLLAVITFDMFTFGMRYMAPFDSSKSYWDMAVVSFLKQDKEPFRVIAPGEDVNSGMASGIETLGGYDGIMLKRYSEFINFSQGLSPDRPKLWMDIKSVNMFTDLLNARYLVIRSGSTVNNPAFSSIFDNGRHRIYRNLNALPRAFVVHDAKVIRDRDAIFRELVSPEFDPLSYAIVEEEPDLISPSHPPGARTSSMPRPSTHPGINPIKGEEEALPGFIEYSPNKVIVDTSLTEPGLLVLGDVYYPGWKAFVDGRETRIYKTNYVMRGVALPAGRQTVEFRYNPLSFKIGTLISLTTLIFMIGFLVWNWRRNEKAEVAP